MSESHPEKPTYLIEVGWHATAKVLRVQARDEIEAWMKVVRMKENVGAQTIHILGEVN